MHAFINRYDSLLVVLTNDGIDLPITYTSSLLNDLRTLVSFHPNQATRFRVNQAG